MPALTGIRFLCFRLVFIYQKVAENEARYAQKRHYSQSDDNKGMEKRSFSKAFRRNAPPYNVNRQYKELVAMTRLTFSAEWYSPNNPQKVPFAPMPSLRPSGKQ